MSQFLRSVLSFHEFVVVSGSKIERVSIVNYKQNKTNFQETYFPIILMLEILNFRHIACFITD